MKAIFYKEWIKTRWFYILLICSTLGFSIYSILRVNRAIDLKGASHIWEVMISRDVIFIDMLQYIPLIAGIVMAIVQFAPEMYHKSIKLTLHLPYSSIKMIYIMLLAGSTLLLSGFLINIIVLNSYFSVVLPPELKWHILNTSFVWYLAGLAGYFLTSWITLEPAWKMRLANLVVALLLIKVYFISDTPEAYNSFLPYLAIYTFMMASLSLLSILRFKMGKQ